MGCDPLDNLAELKIALLALGVSSGTLITRDTSLPSPVPEKPQFFVLDRQASNEGDVLCWSAQNGAGTWIWRIVSIAPDS